MGDTPAEDSESYEEEAKGMIVGFMLSMLKFSVLTHFRIQNNDDLWLYGPISKYKS